MQPKNTGKPIFIKLMSVFVILGILGMVMPSYDHKQVYAQEESEKDENNSLLYLKGDSYNHYISQYADKAIPDIQVLIPAENFSRTDMEVEVLTDFQGESGKTLKTTEEGYVEWEVDVKEEGLYNIGIRYFPIPGKSSAIEREIRIDGEIPFEGARSLMFHRVWKDATPIIQDKRGNDIRPSQIESPMWQEVVLCDSMGYHNEPYQFYFSKGKHTIQFHSIKEPMAIKWLKLYQETPASDYQTVLEEYNKKGYKSTKGIMRKIQGEETLYKSEPTIYPIFDRSSPAMEPYHHSKLKLNAIGGERWQLPGQWVTWEFDVPESGLYKIAIKSKQNVVRGIYTNRKLTIDGETPFREVEDVRFKYDDRWNMVVLGENSEPYLFYLEKGTHQLKLEAILGDMAEILRTIEDSVYELNSAYRKILMITGPTPDPYRDYEFDKRLPEAISIFSRQSVILKDVSQKLEKYTGQKGSHSALLDRMSFQLEGMVRDPDTIAKRFKDFKDNVGALGTWILTTREQPLAIDYIVIASPDEELPSAEKGLDARITHEIKAFLASYSEDYDTIGDIHPDQEAVTVWIGGGLTGGRDQAQIIKQMVDNTFTPETGIPVNLQLISMGALLPATLAGKGPDVALQVNGSDPVNFAVRNAVVDLTQFEDFGEIEKRFHESAVVPYRFQDGVYALPETQSYPMMFYRKDVLEELGLKVPRTWEELFYILPELQKRNMNFGMPQIPPSMPGSGMSGYSIILFQNGGRFYKDNGIASDLDSEAAIQSFKDWTELYTNYKIPIEYDFANRFRVGEIPIGIADYTVYNLLSVFAPEIRGLWEFAPVPGMIQEDGTVDYFVPGGGAGCIMLSQVKDKYAAWEFMKWWTRTDTQVQFGREMESLMGAAARHPTANMEALYQLPWPTKDFNNLMKQWEWVEGIPEVPGGYFTSRHLDFAFRKVVNDGDDPRETLLDYVRIINEEIEIKRKEFGLNLE